MKSKILNLIAKNINAIFICLTCVAIINMIFGVIGISMQVSSLVILSLLSFLFAIYTASNIGGYKFGHRFNVHKIRWWWLKKHNQEEEYQTVCLSYLLVTLPISLVLSFVNLGFAIYNLLLL